MSPRREFYLPVLPEIRKIMIGRMAKPEEVLVVENDNGEVISEQFKVILNGFSIIFETIKDFSNESDFHIGYKEPFKTLNLRKKSIFSFSFSSKSNF